MQCLNTEFGSSTGMLAVKQQERRPRVIPHQLNFGPLTGTQSATNGLDSRFLRSPSCCKALYPKWSVTSVVLLCFCKDPVNKGLPSPFKNAGET
jgi:hypothetical protein